MSDFVIHKGRRAADSFEHGYGSDVVDVIFTPGRNTKVALADGRRGAGTCLGCGSPPCIEKDPSELVLAGILDSYPGDPNVDVCPTKAIRRNPGSGAASVLASECIGCGLCVVRCPYGAISLVGGSVARVETSDPDKLLTSKSHQGIHATPTRIGQIASMRAPAAASLPASLSTLNDRRAMLLVRNLMNEAGLNARVRRRGDTNMRIDAVGYSRSKRPFVAEIELSNGVLESPRALLEDVAILHARYGLHIESIDPVSIVLTLPNIRSEYYQVIRDIESVLQLRCRTITIGALIALVWSCSQIEGFADNAFVVGAAALDISPSLQLDKHTLHEPYPGAFMPVK